MSFDPYHHDILSALTELAESGALEPTMTWDGANNYHIGPAAKYIPFNSGHRAILTKSALESWCDGDLSADALSSAVGWVESNQREWFELFDADED